MKLGQLIFTCLSLYAFLLPQKGKGQTISGVINSYHKATAIINNGIHNSYSYSGLTLQDISGLSTGDRVLIIQMKGATINSTNTSSFGNITDIGNAGKYEFSSICGFLNNTIVLSNHLLHTYDVSLVQVVRVPVYNQDITVTGTLSATPWNASTGLGGVLALEVNGTVTLNANISADSAGFAGGTLIQFGANCLTSSSYSYAVNSSTLSNFTNGAYKGEGLNITNTNYEGGKGKQSNGGGGGNNHNAGGGGGSNYGAGGRGGTRTDGSCNGSNYGIGGAAINSYGYSTGTNKVFLGGGGGSGHENNPEGTPGGNGGGIIYIKSDQLIGNSYSISANGSQGVNTNISPSNASKGDGAGGGGAGGTVLLNVTSYSGGVTIEARGANGNNSGFQAQCPGPGGGGGGGVIWYAGAVPATTNANGGSAGTITSTTVSCNGTSNGGTAGSAGLVQSGFVAPQSTNTIDCSILPLDLLKQFYGKRNNSKVQLDWELNNKEAVRKIVLEKRMGNEAFRTVYEQFYPTTNNGFYVDEKNTSNVSYRLAVFALNGERQYSNLVFFEADARKTLNLYPNPAKDDITIQLPANFNGNTYVVVTDINGRQLMRQQLFIQPSQNNTVVSVKQLPAGIYYIRLKNKNESYSVKLLKQ